MIFLKYFVKCYSLTRYHHIPVRLRHFAPDLDKMERNIEIRKDKNNVPLIRSLLDSLEKNKLNSEAKSQLEKELMKLPNWTHPRIMDYCEEPREVMHFIPERRIESRKAVDFAVICKNLGLCRLDHLGMFSGHKSYYLYSKLAELEQAVVHSTLNFLRHHKWQILSVPDILPADIIQSCGMQTDGERTQVYKLDLGKNCLSGTSEMSLAGFFKDRVLREDELPMRVAAVSRCFRAETSGLTEEKGIYRVHQFTKVEMFVLSTAQTSNDILNEIKDLEIALFTNLGLEFRVLDMPPTELGLPAYEKYDIEAWMPGRQQWGEISSCSNCTDYQAKRLNIRYQDSSGQLRHVHTLNGTAAAIPRLLITLIESNQREPDSFEIPKGMLEAYVKQGHIKKIKSIPEVKFVKHIKCA